MEKVTRATFLYMKPKPGYDPEENAQCESCIHWIDDKDRCELHGKGDDIDGDDSCCLYVAGPNATGKEPLGRVTPKESGLVSRQVRCDNCMFFDPDSEPKVHCDFYSQLNRMLPKVFDLDRYVEEDACCNAQTPGNRNPKVFGPIGPLGEKGEDSDGMKNAIDEALSKRK